MSQDGELLPGAIGAIMIGGNHVEGKLALEFGEALIGFRGGEVGMGSDSALLV